MPSPPDVILVLSPRMAKANRRMLQFFLNGEEINDGDFLGADIAGDWPDDELYNALEALIDEIGEQLGRERVVADQPIAWSPTRDEGSDVAKVAEKMAKAARKAVEPRQAGNMGDADGVGEEGSPTDPEAA